MVNDLRYQPVPPTVKPVFTPPTDAVEKGETVSGRSSMLQSCGTFSTRQLPSSNSVFSAPLTSPKWKRQSASNEMVWLKRQPQIIAKTKGKTDRSISINLNSLQGFQ